MRDFWDQLKRLLADVKYYLDTLPLRNTEGPRAVGNEMIVNPKKSSVSGEVITPRQYVVSDEEALSVVRKHDIVHVRRSRAVQGVGDE